MRVDIVSGRDGLPGHALSTFIIDGVLSVDAGGLGWAAPPAELAYVTDILLTHAHLDHTAGLPVFVDTVYGLTSDPPTVYALPETLADLRAHMFNGRLMPDFVALSQRLPPFLTLCPVPVGRAFPVGRYAVTAWPVDHPVPTVAYLVDDGSTAVAFVTDTLPVPEVVAAIGRHPRLETLYLEATFPDAQADLALVSGHLTVSQYLALADLVPRTVRVRPIHIKPKFAAAVTAELRRGRGA